LTLRDLSVSGGLSTGGSTVQTDVDHSIGAPLQNYSSLVKGGITIIEDMKQNVQYSRWATNFSPSGALENATVNDDVTANLSIMTLGNPSRLSTTVGISKQLIKTNEISPSIQANIEQIVLAATGALIDQAGINALLALSENTSGFADLNKLAAGVTFGAAATQAKLVSMKETLLANNIVDDGTMKYLVSPSTYGRWSIIPQVATFPRYLIDGEKATDLPVVVSNNLTTCSTPHTVLLGRWSSFYLGIWALSIVSDSFTAARSNLTILTINLLYSFAPFYGAGDYQERRCRQPVEINFKQLPSTRDMS
jgi:hypothetical protein